MADGDLRRRHGGTEDDVDWLGDAGEAHAQGRGKLHVGLGVEAPFVEQG
jgi:hypothetical protein